MTNKQLTQKGEAGIKRMIKRAIHQYTGFSPSVRNEIAMEAINSLKHKIEFANCGRVDLKKININSKKK